MSLLYSESYVQPSRAFQVRDQGAFRSGESIDIFGRVVAVKEQLLISNTGTLGISSNTSV